MQHVHHQKCPICEGRQLRTLFEGLDYSHTGEFFPVAVCANCSFVFTQNAPDEQHIGTYYQSENYVSHSDTQKGLFFKVYHWVRSYMLGKKRALVEKYSNQGSVLDVGCGTGYFLNEMKTSGWEVLGVEQDAGARKIGLDKFSLPIHEPAHLFELEKMSLDAITLWHVLEHIHDLHAYIKRFSELLKVNGTLIIAVPNHESFDAKHYGPYWAAWDLPIHLWHFTPQSIKTLFAEHDFTLEAMHSLPFDSFYVSLLSEKYKKGSSIKGFLIGAISWMKSWFNTQKASSVVYVLKKVER